MYIYIYTYMRKKKRHERNSIVFFTTTIVEVFYYCCWTVLIIIFRSLLTIAMEIVSCVDDLPVKHDCLFFLNIAVLNYQRVLWNILMMTVVLRQFQSFKICQDDEDIQKPP